MWHIKAIEKRLSAEEKKRLSHIYEPVVVGVQNEDSRTGLCVMPDGEIRHYGEMPKEHPWDNGHPCYLSSLDAGLTWKEHATEGEEMGSCTYIPELGKYFALESSMKRIRAQVKGEPYPEGTWLRVSAKGPDDREFIRIKISNASYTDEFLPQYLPEKKRIAITAQIVLQGDYHPVFLYSDDGGQSWEEKILKSAPRYEPVYPSICPRWENNGSEPVFTILPDKRLLLMARTSQDYFYAYYSEDFGTTWSDPVPSDFHGTLTTPYFLNLSDGRILFFWNNTQPLPESNHARELPVHEEGFRHKGEGAFTNRDVCHAAISRDGISWQGFRELYLNGIRNRPDFRCIGGMHSSADKSVHQFQALELPLGKVLVAVGQNQVCRRLLLFDPDWLLEKERKEDFSEGLEKISTQMYVKSLSGDYVVRHHPGHCAWNRTNGALLVPSPDMDGTEVLQICRIQDPRLLSDRQGMVWNFPCAVEGDVRVKLRVEGEGVQVCLCDHWFNPMDESVGDLASFSFKITPDLLQRGKWYDLKIHFSVKERMAYVYLDGKKQFGVVMKIVPKYGISYLHLQTDAQREDAKGTLIQSMAFAAMDKKDMKGKVFSQNI